MNFQLFATIYGWLFSQGVVTETADGGLIIESAPGRYIGWTVAFIIAMPISFWLWRRGRAGRFAPVIFFTSFAIPLIVLPGIASESIRVTPISLTIQTGFSFSPTIMQFSLNDLESVIESEEEIKQKYISRTATFWEFKYKSSPSDSYDLNDVLIQTRTIDFYPSNTLLLLHRLVETVQFAVLAGGVGMFSRDTPHPAAG
jgi:hypothetical protein